MKKLISVVVILLFIGLAFAPSINANVGKEELLEFSIESCGFNGDKKVVKLTQQEGEELEETIENIKSRLNNVTTRRETISVFNQALDELNRFHLFDDFQVKIFKRLMERLPQNIDGGPQLVAGRLSEMLFFTFVQMLIFYHNFGDEFFKWLENKNKDLLAAIGVYVFLAIPLRMIIPFNFLSYVHIGRHSWTFTPLTRGGWFPSKGWVFASGLDELSTGNLYGHLGSFVMADLAGFTTHWYYLGIKGFCGFNIITPSLSTFFIGFCSRIKVNSTKP